jgi:hypothetical protein
LDLIAIHHTKSIPAPELELAIKGTNNLIPAGFNLQGQKLQTAIRSVSEITGICFCKKRIRVKSHNLIAREFHDAENISW